MSETVVGVLQGVATGIGILAAGLGLFAASAAGGNFQFVLNGQVLSFHAPAATSVSAAPSTPTETESPAAPEAAVAQAEIAHVAAPAPVEDQGAHLSYYNETAADLSLLVVSLKRMGVLLAAPQPGDEGWRSEMGVVADAVGRSVEYLSAVHPPEQSIDTHSFLMRAAGRCRRVALALDGDLTRLPEETFQLVGDTLAGCTEDVVSVLQRINGTGKK